MFDILYLQELSPYLVIAGLILEAPALLLLYFFIASHMKPVQQYHIEKYDYSIELQLPMQKLFNESNALFDWLTLCGCRKENADEGPFYVLLENKKMLYSQGGQNEKKISIPSF